MPSRLNLICHGMMLFVEESSQMMSICIPTVGTHEHLFGVLDESDPSKATLQGLSRGSYAMGGMIARSAPLATLFGANNYLLLKKSAVTLDRALLDSESAIITVPKPSLVRFFRPAEPTLNVFGSTPVSIAKSVPSVLHDVVVLSYLRIPDGTDITIEGAGTTLFSARSAPDKTINWSLYSSDATAPAAAGAGHETTLNRYLKDKSTSRQTSLILSAYGAKDGPPDTGIGMKPAHTADLEDLPTAPSATEIQLICGRLGCTGGGLIDDEGGN
jgi:hypothetical protein